MTQNISSMHGLTPHEFNNISYFLDPRDIESLLGTCNELHFLSTNDLWAMYFRAKFDPSAQAPMELARNHWQMLCREEFKSIDLVWNRVLPELVKRPCFFGNVPEFPTRSDIPNWIRQYKEQFVFVEIHIENLNISRLPVFVSRLGLQFYIAGNPASCIKDAFHGQGITQIKLDEHQMQEIELWLLAQNSDEVFSRTLLDGTVIRDINRILQRYTGAERVWIAGVVNDDQPQE